MTCLRKALTASLAVVALGLSIAATSQPAAAWGRGGGSGHGHVSRVGHGNPGHHFSGGFHSRFAYGSYGRYGHRWAGYRGYRYNVGIYSAGVGARGCHVGMHLGYEGRYCWPNRS